MRWNNKTRKMFIFIVSLLFVLQAITIFGLAETQEDTSNTDYVTTSSTNEQSTSTETSSSDISNQQSSEITSAYITSSTKKNAYLSAISDTNVKSEDEHLDITSNVEGEMLKLEVEVASNDDSPETTVNVLGKEYITNSGSVSIKIPEVIRANTNSLLVTATTNTGLATSKYVSVVKTNEETTETTQMLNSRFQYLLQNLFKNSWLQKLINYEEYLTE